MSNKEKESIHLLQGTLDLIVLRTLATMARNTLIKLPRASSRSPIGCSTQPGDALSGISAAGAVRVD